MRFLSVCLAAVTCFLAMPGEAAPSPPRDKTIPHIVIAPHRALYDMELLSTRNGSNLAGVEGRLAFEWADACDGWTMQQHLTMHFDYAEGEGSDVTSDDVSWESKNGKHYRFHVKHVTDGQETDVYSGHAAMGAKEGKAVYTVPKNKKMTLPADTLFPTQHTRAMIEHAMAGDRFFVQQVFDGADDEGYGNVSVFVDAPHALEASSDTTLNANPLLAGNSWQVRTAYFKRSSETGEPDYEMVLQLLPNGVVRGLSIDYGDFSVKGTLRAIESLPAPHC